MTVIVPDTQNTEFMNAVKLFQQKMLEQNMLCEFYTDHKLMIYDLETYKEESKTKTVKTGFFKHVNETLRSKSYKAVGEIYGFNPLSKKYYIMVHIDTAFTGKFYNALNEVGKHFPDRDFKLTEANDAYCNTTLKENEVLKLIDEIKGYKLVDDRDKWSDMK